MAWSEAPDVPAAQAQAGGAEAAWRLALKYRNGTGVEQDAVRAGQLMTLAAQGQVPAAMFTLSNMLAAGEGMTADAAAARRWLADAAALGHPAALQQLALTEPDPRKAELLMRQAAHALQHRGPGQ
ncbi:tetratricopeptide repeat protein [Massilia sp. GCM10023247]|uniref:tetratricopeptide repeat protein n=1 Tax=Massilia sp. GCM10023247 TaxID=3252643 RepID=UPI00361459A0